MHGLLAFSVRNSNDLTFRWNARIFLPKDQIWTFILESSGSKMFIILGWRVQESVGYKSPWNAVVLSRQGMSPSTTNTFPVADQLLLKKIISMSVFGESNHEGNFVILNVDIDDCPIAELPLSEIYDVTLSLCVLTSCSNLRTHHGLRINRCRPYLMQVSPRTIVKRMEIPSPFASRPFSVWFAKHYAFDRTYPNPSRSLSSFASWYQSLDSQLKQIGRVQSLPWLADVSIVRAETNRLWDSPTLVPRCNWHNRPPGNNDSRSSIPGIIWTSPQRRHWYRHRGANYGDGHTAAELLRHASTTCCRRPSNA